MREENVVINISLEYFKGHRRRRYAVAQWEKHGALVVKVARAMEALITRKCAEVDLQE